MLDKQKEEEKLIQQVEQVKMEEEKNEKLNGKKEFMEECRKKLKDEPEEGEGVFVVVIKLPFASTHRLQRRFKSTDQVKLVFDFVDLKLCEIEQEKQNFKHCYNLVTAYPRIVYMRDKGEEKSLEQAKFHKKTALLFEELGDSDDEEEME